MNCSGEAKSQKGRTSMDIKDLSPEQQEKVKACNSIDELIALADSEGVDLTDEQLNQVAGGGWTRTTCCSQCKSENIAPTGEFDLQKGTVYKCNDCGAISYAYNA